MEGTTSPKVLVVRVYLSPLAEALEHLVPFLKRFPGPQYLVEKHKISISPEDPFLSSSELLAQPLPPVFCFAWRVGSELNSLGGRH